MTTTKALSAAQTAALRYFAAGQTADRMPHTNTTATLVHRGLVKLTSEATANGRRRIILTDAGRAALGA